ncbi:MAG: hypothetical protein KBA33_04725 [Cloacibacterium sp.]|nr:hypothetical protein [Cloacibacterium sp.]
MKKILLSISLVSSQVIFSQIYTPGGAVNTTENPATGNVGIGTVNPESILDIKANGNIPIIRGNGGYIPTGLRFIDDSYTQLGQVKEWSIWKGNTWAKGLGFYRYDAVNKCAGGICDISLFLHDNGNVGIGTTNPQYKLHVINGEVTSSFNNNEGGTFVLHNSSKNIGAVAKEWKIFNMTGPYGNGLNFWRYFADGSNAGAAVTFSDDGNVGIGTSNPKAKLNIVGGDVRVDNGFVESSIENSEGGRIVLSNPKKINAGSSWVIYNMTDGYSNSLQFWNYPKNWSTANQKLIISDDGHMALFGKLEAKEVKVVQVPTADFVFEKDYQLPTLEEV